MQIIQGVQELQAPFKSSIVTIGNFDGVHLGHQQLIETVVREARFFEVPSVVYTFDPHPVKVLYPERATYRIFDLQDQAEQFQKMGIDNIIIEKFTPDFAQISALNFLEEYLLKKLNPKTLVVGHDFSFGAAREGNLNFLEQFCAKKGIRLIIIPPFSVQGVVASSSKIREALNAGDLKQAELLLNRPYYLRGTVEKGFQRGRTIGVPTANIHPDIEFMPRRGVYLTLTKVGGHQWPSITNIGINPTFSQGKKEVVKIETHLLDFDAQLYGIEVEVELVLFLRDENKFSNVEELKQQIHLDLTQAREFFREKT